MRRDDAPKSKRRSSAAPLSLAIRAELGARHIRYLASHLRAAHRILRPPLNELSLALVADRRMASLHLRFMNVPGPTDVLTFPLDLDARGRPLSGEVVVCVPEARRRSKERKLPLERELLLYALHGLLHLCGYDDRTVRAYRAMHRTEDQILTRLGVGPVFETGQSRPEGPNARPARAQSSPGATAGRRAARRKRKAASGGAH